MKQERLEAATNVISKTWLDRKPVGDWEVAGKALAAADAVMFSDEAVERAAGAIRDSKILPGWFPENAMADITRAVIVALKGDEA